MTATLKNHPFLCRDICIGISKTINTDGISDKKRPILGLFLSLMPKVEIRKEVILLQDTVAAKDKTIAGQQKEIKVYGEERSFIRHFFHSFYLLLNIRLLLRKMGVDDDTFVRMHQKQVAVRSTADVYSGMYKRTFTEENAELRITTNEKRQPTLTINGLSVPDWCEQKWQQLIHHNRSQWL